MPRGKESQGSNRGSGSEDRQGKSERGLASASEATKREVAKKGGKASKGGGRGSSKEGR